MKRAYEDADDPPPASLPRLDGQVDVHMVRSVALPLLVASCVPV